MSKTSIAGATSIGYTSNSYYENDSKTIWLTFFQSSKLNTEAAGVLSKRSSEKCSKFTGEHPCRSVKSHHGMGVLL